MISIIIPTLNEAHNVPLIINQIKKINLNCEIIFVDDDSTDNTSSIIKNHLSKNIKLIERLKKPRDLSKSVMLGVKKSKHKYILVIDCDLQHNLKKVNSMYKAVKYNKCDLAIGSRFLIERYSGNLGYSRSFFSILFIFLINFFLDKKSTDPLSGFFLCKKRIILDYKKNFFLKGYKILFDIIYNGKKNVKIQDFQINFKKRLHGKSKLGLKIVIIFIKQFIYSYLNQIK
jgi:dolichol-phosphate mannosyltransferase